MSFLVAVSGGSDSMALLAMYRNEDIVVAHVNYGIRKQAQKETDIVVQYCEKHNIPYEIYYAPQIKKGNFQQEARKLRYAFFKECCKKYKCDKVLVAHHLDDVIETYYLQKQRGSIPNYYGLLQKSNVYGLCVVRPLLQYTKEELRAFCVQNNIAYKDDESNFQLKYARNKIRHNIVNSLTKAQKTQILQEIAVANKAKEDKYAYLRKLLFEKEIYHISDKTLRNIELFMQKRNGFYPLNTEYVLYKHDANLEIIKKPQDFCYEITERKDFVVKEFRLQLNGEIGGFYVDETDFPLYVRNAQPKDEIELDFGHKKLSRFFIDRKISHLQRKTWPIVVNKKNEVLFVPKLGVCKKNKKSSPNLYLIMKEDKED